MSVFIQSILRDTALNVETAAKKGEITSVRELLTDVERQIRSVMDSIKSAMALPEISNLRYN